MAITMKKKEIEKRKRERRMAKMNRAALKATQKKKTFKEMIAYVDPFGNIHDEPIDKEDFRPVSAREIDIDDPTFAVEQKDSYDGEVEFFNSEKGFGFIKDMSNLRKYFFHITNAPDTIQEGQKVAFDIRKSDRGLNAINISYI